MEKIGYIYILTNQSFHQSNWIKIGYSENVERRVRELSNTSLPLPFEIYATYEIKKSEGTSPDLAIHELIHMLNSNLRINPNREFFEIEPLDAYNMLYLMASIHGREDKLKLNYDNYFVKKEKKEELEISSRLEVFTFSKCNLKEGDELHFIHDSSIKCYVKSDKRVMYNNKQYSLSALAKELLKINYGVAGPHYFTYKGEKLCDLRERIQNEYCNN